MTIKEYLISTATKHSEANVVLHTNSGTVFVMIHDNTVHGLELIPDEIANAEILHVEININGTDIELFT